jgi:hypothetical protein
MYAKEKMKKKNKIIAYIVGAFVVFCIFIYAISTIDSGLRKLGFLPTYTPTFTQTTTPTKTPTVTLTITPTLTITLTPKPTNTSIPHPEGSSGFCNDGTYTYADNRQGACSSHGGICTYWGKGK